MTKNQALGVVLRVACMTEDRDSEEQRALIDTALALDAEMSAFVGTNTELQAPRYVRMVAATYEPSAGRRVRLTAAQSKRYAAIEAGWKMCRACHYPMGAHGLTENGKPRCVDNPHDKQRLTEAMQR